MILYYFLIAQNTVSEKFYRGVYVCTGCLCTYFTILLFTGLIPVLFAGIKNVMVKR